MKKIVKLLFLASLLLLSSQALGETGLEPLSLSISLDRDTVDITKGESVTATLNVKGGVPPYYHTVNWRVIDDGTEQFVTGAYDEAGNLFSFTPFFGESGELRAWVRDSMGSESYEQAMFGITGESNLDPLVFTASLNKDTVQAGGELTLSMAMSGAVMHYNYRHICYVYDGDGLYVVSNGTACGGETYQTTLFVGFGQHGYVEAWVFEVDGRTSEKVVLPFIITGSPETSPLTVQASLSSDSVRAGESLTANAAASGGTPPYKFSFSWKVSEYGKLYNLSYVVGEESKNTQTIRFGGSGYVLIYVEDTLGRRWSSAEIPFDILDSEKPGMLTVSAHLEQNAVQDGQKLALSWDITGGNPPYTTTYGYEAYSDEFRTGWTIHETGASAALMTVDVYDDSYTRGVAAFSVSDAFGRYAYMELPFSILHGDNLPETGNPGDANNDGSIDILDLVSIIDYIVSDTDPASPANADANGDGAIDILDLVWIIDQIVGG